MNQGQVILNVKGIRELVSNLEKLPEQLRKSAEKAVLRSGAVPIRKAAKANAAKSKDTGLLMRSIGLSVKKVRGVTSARVGPRSMPVFKKKAIARKDGKRRKKGEVYSVYQNPKYYSHLVEYGTSHSAAKPFIRPAIDQSQDQILGAMAEGLDKHLTRVAARLKR